MAQPAAENTSLRLKSVLDVLTEHTQHGTPVNAGEVLAEATGRVPFSDYEAALLSGGIPRGHKALTAATAKLVKAGWLVKGRGGWTITEDGMKATVAFPDAKAFSAALAEGTPVPADTKLPDAASTPAPASGKKPSLGVMGKAAQMIDDAVEPVKKAVRSRRSKAPAAAAPAVSATGTETGAAEATAKEIPTADTSAADVFRDQPDAVAVVGDFGMLGGAPENWAPQFDEVQMVFDVLEQVWTYTADLPAGHYTFKIALNRSWQENYGAFGIFDGANHEVHHGGGTLAIRYDHEVKDITFG
ncbi:glycosidase [Pseudarthrobacter sp. PS3-L1]|uniref:pullulanase X25 domain-containing protein n=1 Tax=Pseudarthrobacter sp. PS3-L1 TaxID=3046207 RepID=UPI0024BAE64D|nr:glycosidase [Pseudarthrobacter sp. PS3-L1]MDJ0319452.1 glycosidase [Pseudarthrobacter sp. PS3-L1]